MPGFKFAARRRRAAGISPTVGRRRARCPTNLKPGLPLGAGSLTSVVNLKPGSGWSPGGPGPLGRRHPGRCYGHCD